MAAHDIQLSDDDLLAEYVPLDAFKGWAERRLAVNPDLLAVLIRNGQVVSADKGGNIGIGGFWRGIKDALVGQHALRLLIADLKPFQMIAGISGLSRDKVPVGGEIAIDFQIDPEQGAGVLGLMREHSAVFKDEVMARIAPHLSDRVIETIVGQMDAADLRGSTMVQDKVQAEIMREVERIAGDMSLLVRSVSVQWEFNAEEIAAIDMRAMQRDQERADAELNALTREMEREQVATELRLTTDLNEEKVKAASEDELRSMILSQELAFVNARDSGKRIQEIEELQHEITKIKKERMAKLEDAVANTTNDLELAKLNDQIRDVQRRTERLDTEQALALKRLQDMQEIEIADAAKKKSIENLNDLTDSELRAKRGELDISESSKDGDTDRAIRLAEATAKADLEKLKVQGTMTPELALAIASSGSPAAAEALVAMARAKASDPNDTAEMMKLVQASIDSKDEQNRHAIETIATATIGVAEGAGGGTRSAGAGATEIACSNPDCGKPILATAKFCHHCGKILRT